MDALVFSPLIQAPGAMKAAGRRIDFGSGGSESFARYMDRKLSEGSQKGNLLGVAREPAGNLGAAGGKRSSGRSSQIDEAALAELLSGFMLELKGIAEAESEARAGEWSFALPDSGLLRRLGESAGMGPTDLSPWLDTLSREGRLTLSDFFTALAKHFERQAQPGQVIAPETDLPLLSALLSRMGLPMEQINRLGEQGVVADGSLDLTRFLAGIQSLEEAGEPITLSSLEVEQLRSMLTDSGVSRHHLEQLLPAGVAGMASRPFEPEAPETRFSLEQLRNLLQQALAAVEADRPRPDLPLFFQDLDQILARAGFQAPGGGWSPAVQQTLEAMYRELLQSVEYSRVQIEPAKMDQAAKAAKDLELQAEEEAGEQAWFALQPEEEPRFAADLSEGPAGAISRPQEQLAGRGRTQEIRNGLAALEVAGSETRSGGVAAEVDGSRSPAGPRLTNDVQQQVLHQLSSGVLKGLGSSEHHLVLKLHPRELGEVRVEMLVRDHQVSLAITMENSRVKEVLESNLGQFRENLERQGFSLGECMVSVDQREDSGQAWQRFLSAWKSKQESGSKRQGGGQAGGEPRLTDMVSPADRERGLNIIV